MVTVFTYQAYTYTVHTQTNLQFLWIYINFGDDVKAVNHCAKISL